MLLPGKAYYLESLKSFTIPLIENPVKCGFPSPALDYMEKPVDLNEILISNKTATFLFIAEGNSMEYRHIPHGSLLIIDRSLNPLNGHIVLADLDGEFTLKTLDVKLKQLLPANPAFEPILLDGKELRIYGVVTHVIINPYRSYVRPC